MAPADDDPSTSGARDPHALYEEYQQSNDPRRKQRLLREIYTEYQKTIHPIRRQQLLMETEAYAEFRKTTDPARKQQLWNKIRASDLAEAPDDIWLLLCDVRMLVASCCSIEAAERLLLEHAHNGGFLRYSWHQSRESLRGPNPQHRGIDPRSWGKSTGYVHYPVDWANSAVAYVREEVSPYSPQGAGWEAMEDFLPAEPYFQIDLVKLPLRDVLAMMHQFGLLPDVSPSKPPLAAGPEPKDPPAPTTVTRQEWWDAYLTPQRKNTLPTEYRDITAAGNGIHSLMMKDPAIDGGAYKARHVENLLRKEKVFPPAPRGRRGADAARRSVTQRLRY
jgi:hypothetical protein